MIPIKELQAENAEITDLCTVLNTLLADQETINSPIVCELLIRFTKAVNAHLEHEDRSVYSDLLAEHTDEARKLADRFLNNTHELRRLFKGYEKDWCKSGFNGRHKAAFVDESREMFRLVCDRVEFENQKIFPIFATTA